MTPERIDACRWDSERSNEIARSWFSLSVETETEDTTKPGDECYSCRPTGRKFGHVTIRIPFRLALFLLCRYVDLRNWRNRSNRVEAT